MFSDLPSLSDFFLWPTLLLLTYTLDKFLQWLYGLKYFFQLGCGNCKLCRAPLSRSCGCLTTAQLGSIAPRAVEVGFKNLGYLGF